MSNRFQQMTIRKKLGWFSGLIVSISLMLASVMWMLIESVEESEKLESMLEIQARMLASNIASTLVFSDQQTAQEDLASLNVDQNILGAVLFDADGNFFAQYSAGNTATEKLQHEGFYTEADAILYYHNVTLSGSRVGTLMIRKSTRFLHDDMLNRGLIGLAIFTVVLLFALFLSRLISRTISAPVQRLAQVMGEVRIRGDFSLRVDEVGDEELAEMGRSFNAMLDEIDRRERSLAGYRDELEVKVEERTGELEQTKALLEVQNLALSEALESSKSANKAKSQFLANMSHEIRTPMNGVFGMAELLMESGLNQRQLRMAETIKKSGDNLLEIINDILDFSKIEAGKMDLHLMACNVRDILEDIAELYFGRANSKGVELSCIARNGVPELVMLDPVRLTQVLGNLAGNAVKFTEQGEVVLQAEVEQRNGRLLLSFEVRDTGIGIASEQLEHIFTSFAQSDASTTRRFGGTGLGLTISRDLIQLMGGELKVESRLGEGSVFHFAIAVDEVEAKNGQLLEYSQDEAASIHALVVDDREVNCEIIKHHLDGWDIKNKVSHDGHSALKRMHEAVNRGEPFNLVILDMNMPGMNGLELADHIVADQQFAGVRLMLVSSVADLEAEKHICDSRIQYRLSKPLRRADLFRSLFNRSQSEGEWKVATTNITFAFGRILLVEDNAVNQLVAQQVLKRAGLSVDTVDNGEKAVAAVRDGKYDLILMDCQMPVMDGLEATARIRAYESTLPEPQHTPIIAMTANVQQEDRERCMDSGMDDFLPKPFTLASIKKVLTHWLNETDKLAEALNVEVAHREDYGTHVDMRVLEEIRAIDPECGSELVSSVLEIYLHQSMPQLLRDIHSALTRNDIAEVAKIAHSMKSGSANVGAIQLVEFCSELQLLKTSDHMERIRELVSLIEQEAEIVNKQLMNLIKGADV